MFSVLLKVVSNLGSKGVSVLLAMGMQIKLAQDLSFENYGLFALLQIISMGLALFAQSGFQNAYMKVVSESLFNQCGFLVNRYVLYTVLKKNLLALLFFCFAILVLTGMNRLDNWVVAIWFSLFLICQSFLFVLIGWYRAIDRAYVASFIEHGSYSGLTLILLVLVSFFSGKKADLGLASFFFFLSSAIVLFFSAIPYFVHTKLHVEREAEIFLKSRIAPLANRFLIIQLANYLTSWTGVLIAGVFLNAGEVASLSVAQRIAQVMAFFFIAFNGVLAPKFALLNASHDRESLKLLAQRANKILTLITLIVFFATAFLGKKLLGLFGEAYIDGYSILMILTLGQAINAIAGISGVILNMSNKEELMRNIVVFASLFSVVSSFILTYFVGLLGAAISVALGLLVINLCTTYFNYLHFGFVAIIGFQWIKKETS